MMDANILKLLIKNPMSIFVILTLVYGYLYYEQNQRLQQMLLEVGGLRVEAAKMHNLIKLSVDLAEAKCTH